MNPEDWLSLAGHTLVAVTLVVAVLALVQAKRQSKLADAQVQVAQQQVDVAASTDTTTAQGVVEDLAARNVDALVSLADALRDLRRASSDVQTQLAEAATERRRVLLCLARSEPCRRRVGTPEFLAFLADGPKALDTTPTRELELAVLKAIRDITRLDWVAEIPDAVPEDGD